MPNHPDGRKPTISDGYHSLADVRAGKAQRQHRGCDVMYRKPHATTPVHPYSSKWYEIPNPAGGWDCPVLAVGVGRVVVAEKLATGFWVALDMGGGVGVAYHHLRAVWAQPGAFVGEGTELGLVGGSPVGYGLWHLHFDRAVGCSFGARHLAKGLMGGTYQDPASFLRGCIYKSVMGLSSQGAVNP